VPEGARPPSRQLAHARRANWGSSGIAVEA
jgi:hypothetical protein